MPDIHLLAVLVAAILAFVIGFTYYTCSGWHSGSGSR